MALTDAVCRSAKPGPKRRKFSDGGGLQLWVQTSGARLWQFVYRFQGRQRQLALGRYPEISLAEARIKREDARRLLRAGDDPAAAARRAPRPNLIANTLKGALAQKQKLLLTATPLARYARRRYRLSSMTAPIISKELNLYLRCGNIITRTIWRSVQIMLLCISMQMTPRSIFGRISMAWWEMS